jgi:transcription elongation factor GreA
MTQSTEQSTIWLTQEAHDKLTAELEDLKGPRRQEARIRQLEDMLRRAEVGETPPDDGVVEQGMKVTIRFVDFDDEETFLFGAREMEEEGLTVYSPQSALGEAIDGKKRGDRVSYTAPNGKDVNVEIVDAVPFTG